MDPTGLCGVPMQTAIGLREEKINRYYIYGGVGTYRFLTKGKIINSIAIKGKELFCL